MRPLLLLFFALAVAAADAQHLTYQEWVTKAMQDLRLQPRYGNGRKSEAQRASDAEFVQLTLAQDSVPRSASNRLVAHGFDLLKQDDLTKAMFRFNQAFLVDSTNSDAYWGYGTFFMELDKPAMAHTMYRAGLSVDSTNAHLLVGEATAYLAEHHALATTDSTAAMEHVHKALAVLQKAQRYDPRDPDLLYRMSVCHYLRGECDPARAYFNRVRNMSHVPVDKTYEQQLNARCVPR